MKNLTKTSIACALGAILLFANLVAAAFDKAIQKIVITGNVRVTLVQANDESVKILDDYDSERTLIKMKGYSLLIHSQESVPINVTVYAKDPYRIEASNNSYVATLGTFNLKNLQVILKDHARAKLNSLTSSLYTVVKDDARLKISGISSEHFANFDSPDQLDMNRLACTNTSTFLTKPFTMNAKNIIPNKKAFRKNKKMRT
jgi:hypothetical protein